MVLGAQGVILVPPMDGLFGQAGLLQLLWIWAAHKSLSYLSHFKWSGNCNRWTSRHFAQGQMVHLMPVLFPFLLISSNHSWKKTQESPAPGMAQ